MKKDRINKRGKKTAWKSVFAGGAAFLILLGIVAGIVLIISAFGGTIMRLFGFQYDSVGSVVAFFVISGLISYPVDLLTSSFPRALFTAKILGKRGAVFLRIVLDTLFSAVSMAVVDSFMESVSASDMALLMVCLVFAVADVWMDEREAKEKKE